MYYISHSHNYYCVSHLDQNWLPNEWGKNNWNAPLPRWIEVKAKPDTHENRLNELKNKRGDAKKMLPSKKCCQANKDFQCTLK